MNSNSSAPSGWYYITPPGGSSVRLWCDMTTDLGGYSYYPCNNCASFYSPLQANGCTNVGLQMVIPRTRAHWGAMSAFVSNVLGASFNQYFAVVPGIYRPNDGYGWPDYSNRGNNYCNGNNGGSIGILNSDSCAGRNSWRATDGGPWWLRSSQYSEPNGVRALSSARPTLDRY